MPGITRYDDVHIDLEPLSRFAGARLYHDEIIGLDLANRIVRCRHHADVSYNVLSLNIGSTPGFAQVPGAEQFVVPVKPISNFVQRWQQLVPRVLATRDVTRIGVVGAGAGGIELTLAIQFRLRQLLQQAGRATPWNTTSSALPPPFCQRTTDVSRPGFGACWRRVECMCTRAAEWWKSIRRGCAVRMGVCTGWKRFCGSRTP